eukprot:TRINITY_DN82918_c0_g1_i1.p1 TRINITY_DN82918_c0_g1~~TRINITY_DN82918_c0_g1_i1.p1  ORF type:complete len:168 (-),score=34.62 TRINITY_DN82918_c0_g1_i1:120-572(-)
MSQAAKSAAIRSCGLCTGLFCACFLSLLILAGIVASVMGAPCNGDESMGLCEHRMHYADMGKMLMLLLGNFLGFSYVDSMDVQEAANNKIVDLILVLSALLGKAWLVMWAIGTLYWFSRGAAGSSGQPAALFVEGANPVQIGIGEKTVQP